MSAKRLRLGVNVDHIATIRNARGGALPDPVRGALLAIEAGADGITAHLREDSPKAEHEFERIRVAAEKAAELGLECHAGHGLDYATAKQIAGLPQIVELNIGHFLMGEALFVGLPQAIRTMRKAMDEGRPRAPWWASAEA